MATERDRFEILVELLGIEQVEQRARKGAQALEGFNRAVRDSPAARGGSAQASRDLETSAFINFSQAQTRVNKLEAQLRSFLKRTDAGKAIAETIEAYPIRTTKAGRQNLNDIRSRDAAIKRLNVEPEDLQKYYALREQLLAAVGREAAARGKAALQTEKREKLEEQATAAYQQRVAAEQLDAQRRKGQAGQLAQAERDRIKAEKEIASASQQLANQRRRAQAAQAATEGFVRENRLSDAEIAGYRKPLVDIKSSGEPERSAVELAKAQAAETQALRRHTAIDEKNARGDLSAADARLQFASAQAQLTGAIQRRTIAEERLAAESGGFGAQFGRGFRGASDRPYAEQLGQAVKFSAFYGAAYRIQFALLQTFRDALTEGINFQQGLSDMAIATGRSKEELTHVAENLAQIASDAGTSPSAGLQIGARAVGLYGLAGSSDKAQQDYVAELSARVVSKLALGSKVDPVTLQQNLAAITQATGLGAGGQIRVADLDSYFAKRFGTAPGDTLEAGAQSASVGIAAGFSIEEVQALAALMISRTGQTSSAVGGYLAQIFSRGGEGSLTGVAQKFGIDTNGRQLADVFDDLAKKYRSSGAAAQAEISAAFGRGKVQNAVVTALQDFDEVKSEARAAASGDADGALDKAFAERVNNIGGQITVLGGHFKEFAHLFGESGLLAVLGLGVEVLDHLLTAANSVLLAFNELPGPLRTFAGLLLAAVAAQRLGLTGAVGGAVAGRFRYALEGAQVAGAAGGLAGVRTLGVAALRMLGPIGLATGGLLAIGALTASARKLKDAQDGTVAALRQSPGADASPTELRNYASQLKEQARIDAEAGNPVRKFLFGKDLDGDATRLRAEADRLQSVADDLEANAKPDKPAVFAGFDSESLGAGLDAISRQGGTAADRLAALGQAIEGVGEKGANAAAKFNPDLLAGPLAAAAAGVGKVKVTDYIGAAVGPKGQVNPYAVKSNKDFSSEVGSQLTGSVIQDVLADQMEKLGITRLDRLTPEQIASISLAVSSQLKEQGDIKSPDALSAVQSAVTDLIGDALRDQVDGVLDQVLGQSLSGPELISVLAQIRAETQGAIDDRPQTDFAGRIRAAQAGLKRAFAARRNTRAVDRDSPQALKEIATARERVASAQIDQLEALRKVAVADSKTQREASRRADGFIRRELKAAVRAGSQDQLARVLSTVGPGYKAVAQAFIDKAAETNREAQAAARAVANTAAKLQAAMDAMIANYLGALALIPPIFVGGQAVVPGTVLTPKSDSKPPVKTKGLNSAVDTTTPDYNADQIPKGGSDEPKETAAERRAARLAAEAARKGGDIAAAKAAIASAQAALQKAKKGTVEYYNALASFYQAKDQLNEALRNYKHILRELKIDTTDPLAEAQLALTEARRKLRYDIRHHKGRDVIAQDKLDVKNAQNEAEATAFSQRLEDVQTAEELGRISHGAYLRYLQSEHNRLSAISKRTRQQQDELNQIDRLIKDAQGELEGQFNIGDIKLPTPYEVRRYLKTQVQSTPFALDSANGGTTTIYINGADTGAVRRIIEDTVGKGTRVLTTTTRRT